MRFGSIHFKKFKEGKTKIKSQLSGQISFLILLKLSQRITTKKLFTLFSSRGSRPLKAGSIFLGAEIIGLKFFKTLQYSIRK